VPLPPPPLAASDATASAVGVVPALAVSPHLLAAMPPPPVHLLAGRYEHVQTLGGTSSALAAPLPAGVCVGTGAGAGRECTVAVRAAAHQVPLRLGRQV